MSIRPRPFNTRRRLSAPMKKGQSAMLCPFPSDLNRSRSPCQLDGWLRVRTGAARAADKNGSLVLRALVVRAPSRCSFRNGGTLAMRLQLLVVLGRLRGASCGRRCCVGCLCESLNGNQRESCSCERGNDFFHVLIPKPERLCQCE